jgi:Tfp pilus assembly protein PilF
MEFRRALAGRPGGLEPWLLFALGYLFQSRGFHDSAFVYYRRSDSALAGAPGALRIAVLNNLGVAAAEQADTLSAVAAFSSALALFDTTGDTRDARTLRDNIRRVSARRTQAPAPGR